MADKPDKPLNLYAVLSEEFERLHADQGTQGTTEAVDTEGDNGGEELSALFARFHEPSNQRSALCISGGGIRSATFSLGVIQRLAKCELLPKFDYISTVSGGGFIGSWLSSWARRHEDGMDGVAKELGAAPTNPLEPEPKPVCHLRSYSNYLTPRLGLFSGDTWAAVATYLRNLLLNWLVLVPAIFAVLAIPRIFVAVVHCPPESFAPVEWITGIAFTVALFYLAWARPAAVDEGRKCEPADAAPSTGGTPNRFELKCWLRSNGGFISFGVLPFLIVAIGITLMWAWRSDRATDPGLALLIVCVISAIGSMIYMARYLDATRRSARRDDVKRGSSRWKYNWKKLGLEFAAAVLSGAAATALFFTSVKLLPAHPMSSIPLPSLTDWQTFPASIHLGATEPYVTFAVPLFLLILAFQAAMFVGLSSWFNEDYDREWWSRAGGWVLITAVGWLTLSAITIWGPVLIYLSPKIFAALGGASGIFSILCGKSPKTSGSSVPKASQSKGASALDIGLKIAAPLFIVCLLAAVSLVTSKAWLAASGTRLMTSEEIASFANSSYRVTANRCVGQPAQLPGGCANGERTFESASYPAVEADWLHAVEHLYALDHATPGTVTSILIVGLAASFFFSLFIGVNTFSLHAFYRNRLIRAYLGASRHTRRPNPFTGFDPNDNVAMQNLRSEAFWVHSFLDVDGFAKKLEKPEDQSRMIQFVASKLSRETRARMKTCSAGVKDDDLLKELLFGDLNRLIDDDRNDDAFSNFEQSDRTYSRIRSVRNRTILDEQLPHDLRPMASPRPLHVVNMAMNLVAGQNLAWQQRKADSFTVSPLHAGNHDLGYRPARRYGGPAGISLGTAVAISGAAVSPNMGYHTSPTLSFLLTLFNVRLGAWLGNPAKSFYGSRNPTWSIVPLLRELFGLTTRDYAYVYLSDGGHFDNLGLYEMALRRCHSIVLIDAGADPSFKFEDLGNAIRKIRIDLGIPIDVDTTEIQRRKRKTRGAPHRVAIGRIHYGAMDGTKHPPIEPGKDCQDERCGQILYIKPTFYDRDEPRDVYNYAHVSETFPHETTGDQFFSESQFESYRALGAFVMDELLQPFSSKNPSSPADFITRTDELLRDGSRGTT